jgi:uncharacterized SAM-binding protein YcdF (DUF218 family)
MARRPRFRRQRFLLLRLVWRALRFVGLLWLFGFVIYLGVAFLAAPPNPMPQADGIVALTGGDERIATALALLDTQNAPLLLISGAGPGTYLGDFTRDDARAATRHAKDITLGHQADSTHGNALEAAAWAHAHRLHSLIIVTADYHMPRAMLEMRDAMPAAVLIADPVRPPAMRKFVSLVTLRMLAGEYTKYLVVRAGLRDALAVRGFE